MAHPSKRRKIARSIEKGLFQGLVVAITAVFIVACFEAVQPNTLIAYDAQGH